MAYHFETLGPIVGKKGDIVHIKVTPGIVCRFGRLVSVRGSEHANFCGIWVDGKPQHPGEARVPMTCFVENALSSGISLDPLLKDDSTIRVDVEFTSDGTWEGRLDGMKQG